MNLIERLIMWLMLAFISAFLLGFYDVFKKKALHNNAVIPVLFLNTLFSSFIFVPLIIISSQDALSGTLFHVESMGLNAHLLILLKSFIVLTSWIFGYFGLKHLPITIVGPINATRPVIVLLGAMIIFGERLNGYQWIGVLLAGLSLFLLSRTGKKEGINFRHNKWILFVAISAIAGSISGLYDKFLMGQFSPMFVQSWFNVYQVGIMSLILMVLWWPKRHFTTPFHWSWSILMISIILAVADFVYFYSLSFEESMISVVSMIRRGSVVVSFACGAMLFKEKNLKSKAFDLALIILGLIFLYIGSR